MAQAQNLVNAPAGRRLCAALLDAVPYLIAYAVLLVQISGELVQGVSGATMSITAVVLPSVFMLAYALFLWGWEAMTGKTPGNLLLGIRTTNEDGFAPGWGRVFVRRLIIGLSNVVPLAGPIVVLLSNLWDSQAQRQGWHDKIAKTLVVDVRTGRNPITTGGLFGPAAFAPQSNDPQQPATGYRPSPVTDPADARFDERFDAQGYPLPAQRPEPRFDQALKGPITGVPGSLSGASAPQTPAAPVAPHSGPSASSAQETSTASTGSPVRLPPPPPSGPTAEPVIPAAAADQPGSPEFQAAPMAEPDSNQTMLHAPAPAEEAALLAFDDGQSTLLRETVLIGRNPAPAPGEGPVDLVNFADMGRSVSKTHLAVTLLAGQVWVTDRNSTNGSGVTGIGSGFRALEAGVPEPVRFGDTVHFGDRSFEVRRP